MKSLTKISLAAALFLLFGLAAPAQAQVNINVNPPSWGPAVGPNTQYYYIPEIDGYYDVRDQQYVLLRNGQWARVVNSGYDPRSFHPVVVDYIGAQPWIRIEEYRTRYHGNPHGMPPGQAKKYYGRGYSNNRGGRDYDDDDNRGYNNRGGRDNDNRGDGRGYNGNRGGHNDDDQGEGRGKGHKKGHDKED